MKEQKRLKVITELDAGRMKAREAAGMLDLSVRQVRRLIAAYRKEGAAASAHGNRGRRSVHRISEEVRDRILELARGPYHDYKDTHFAEKLGEQHGILVSRSTVRPVRSPPKYVPVEGVSIVTLWSPRGAPRERDAVAVDHSRPAT